MVRTAFTGVISTDEVNLQNIRVPVEALTSGLEKRAHFSIEFDLPFGVPTHIGHDMHRPVGWCVSQGILLSADLARQLGSVLEPESDAEKQAFDDLIERCWRAVDADGLSPFEAELRERALSANPSEARSILCEAAALQRPGLAAELYPELFTPSMTDVDKDGLVDFRTLLSKTRQVQAGVFHEPVRDLTLFAHPFFRRSLSRRNSLNTYFLSDFTKCAVENDDLRVRIRLDPDMVGHPDSVRHIFEFEYWHGPKFKPSIVDIPNGVAEHKADASSRHYEGIDKTQLWWKAEETREVAGTSLSYRTFEAEELIENPSHGISDQHFGCRYIHAEFSASEDAITHFDGAIRAYDGNAYLDRIGVPINRAGKRADYTKLFRFDGHLSVNLWKALAANFYRGNLLIPEYFGGDARPLVVGSPESEHGPKVLPPQVFRLVAFISFHRPSAVQGLAIASDSSVSVDGADVFYLDLPPPALQAALFVFVNPAEATFLQSSDRKLNFPSMIFGSAAIAIEYWAACLQRLTAALGQDLEAGLLDQVSFCFEWPRDGIVTKLAIAGDARCVRALLQDLEQVVAPARVASDWVARLKERVADCASRFIDGLEPEIIVTDEGALRLRHSGEASLLEPVSRAVEPGPPGLGSPDIERPT